MPQDDKSNMPWVGAGVGGAAGLALVLRRYAGLRNTLVNKALGILPKALQGTPAPYAPKDYTKLIEELRATLISKGIDPSQASIGISGASGSGKSTLAAQLASAFGAKHVDLDQHLVDGSPWQYISRNAGRLKGKILEQSALLTEVSPETFDAILHVNPSDAVQRAGLLSRERARALSGDRALWPHDYSHLADDVDFSKLRKTLDTLFRFTKGEAGAQGDVRYVVKPSFDRGSLSKSLTDRGINPSGLNFKDRLLTEVAEKATITEAVPNKAGLDAFSTNASPIKATVAATAAAAAAGGMSQKLLPTEKGKSKKA